MKKLLTLFVLLIQITLSTAQENYPKPTAKDVIFYIQHNRGKNTFFYTPNFKSKGILDDKNPIITSRQIFDNDGEIKPLSNVQRKFAYGVNTKKIDVNHFELTIVSQPNQKLTLKLDKNNKAYIETIVSNKHIKLDRIFIHQKDGTSGLATKVDFITFYGTDSNHKQIQIKVDPNN